MHKRQRLDAYQTRDRTKFENIQPPKPEKPKDNDPKDEDDSAMAGPSLDLFFP